MEMELVSWTSPLLAGWCLGAWLPAFCSFVECLELDLGLGCCLLDGTRLPAFVECFSSRMLLWVVAAASKCVASEVFICR